MRIAAALSVAGLAAILATCGADALAPADDSSAAGATAPPPTGNAGDDTGSSGDPYTIACALNGASGFDSTCTVERRMVDGEQWLTVFHPDGGFRIFMLLPEGAGLAAVAGAHEVEQVLTGDTLEISIAGNRYRFPATSD